MNYLPRIVMTALKTIFKSFWIKKNSRKAEATHFLYDSKDYSCYKDYIFDLDEREDIYLKRQDLNN